MKLLKIITLTNVYVPKVKKFIFAKTNRSAIPLRIFAHQLVICLHREMAQHVIQAWCIRKE